MEPGKEALMLTRNMFRIGQVNTVREERGTVEVLFEDKDSTVTDELPMLSYEYDMPDVGDDVLCLFLPTGLERGFCLGSFFSRKNPPPVQDKNIIMKKLDEDAYIEYNKQDKSLKIVTDGPVTIEGGDIYLADGASEGVPLGDQLKSWLDSHAHDYTWTDSGGSGTTDSPDDPSPESSERVKVK